MTLGGQAFADTAQPDYLFELSYSAALVSPSDLNSARQAFEWNNTTNGTGSFKMLSGLGGSFGYQVVDGMTLLLQIKSMTQSLGATSVSGTPAYSVTESFEYDPIYLLADVPFAIDDTFTVSIRGGFGYAYRFELRQQISANNELVVWNGHPIPLQLGATGEYKFFDSFGAYFGLHYEYVKSTLKAVSNYQTTINGQPITSGQTYTNVGTGANATADMSGMEFELGLRLTF